MVSYFFFKWRKENLQPFSISLVATHCPSLYRLFLFLIAQLRVETQFRMFSWTNLFCSLLVILKRKKKISPVTETLGSLVVRSWKEQGGYQRGFQLPSQRTHPFPLLSSSISLPSVLITVLLGHCIPEGPTVPSVLSEALPRAAPLVTWLLFPHWSQSPSPAPSSSYLGLPLCLSFYTFNHPTVLMEC